MSRQRSARARRVETDLAGPVTDHDYASSFAVAAPDAGAWSAERWARTTFEAAPRALRGVVVLGWKAVLRLRLGPSASAGYVLGWHVREATPESIVLEVHSAALTAKKVLRVGAGRVTLTTFVTYDRGRGRLLWSAVAPVHHRLEPLLLTRAAARFLSRSTHAEPS